MPKESKKWGGYRISEVPKILGEQNKKDIKFIFEDEWKLHKYNDSYDFEKIKEEITIEN
jgi:hypothetical protein